MFSIFLNGALAAVLIAGLKKKESPQTANAQTDFRRHEEKRSDTSELKTPATSTTAIPAKPAVPRFNWREVESPDYKEYIAKLRAIHCPEETIIDIIVADVSKFYRSKLAPYRKPPEKFKFWENDDGWSRPRDVEFEKMARDNEKEKRKLLKELLGIDYAKEMAKQTGWPQREEEFYKQLSADTKEKMSEIQQKFQEMKSDIYRKTRGYQDEDDAKELRKIEKLQTAELAKILTPEQLEEYQMRSSSIAQNLKYNELQGFEASEPEFRAIVKAKLAAEDMQENPDTGEKLSREERAKLAKENAAALKEALGGDRYKELKLNEDYGYRELVKIAEKVGVDKAAAAQVHQMKDEVEKATRKIQSDRKLTPEQKKEKLQAIRAATEQEVAQQLGERGAKAYARNQGYWIRNISPKDEVPKAWSAPK
ncbi:MAG: hypothetical protein ACR2H1_08395 [Limisphaerales bacterium]